MKVKVSYVVFLTGLILLFLAPVNGNVSSSDNKLVGTLNGKAINCLHKQKNGYVLAGTSKGLYQVNDNQLTEAYPGYKLSKELSGLEINEIGESSTHLYLATKKGLYQIDKKTEGILKVEISGIEDIDNAEVNCLIYTSKGRLMIGLNGYGCISFIDDDPVRFTREGGQIPNDTIYDLVEDRNGLVWLATADGNITRFNSVVNKFKPFSYNSNGLQSARVNSLNFYKDRLLIGTEGDGMYVFETTNQDVLHVKPDSVHTDFFKNISSVSFEEGNIWVSSVTEGLANYKDAIYGDFNTDINVNKLFANSLVAINKSLWYGTVDGEVGLLLPQSKKFAVMNYFMDDRNRITAITKGFDQYWLGTSGGQVMVVQHDNVTKKMSLLEDSSGYNSAFAITSMVVDISSNIWIGTKSSGVYYLNSVTGVVEKSLTHSKDDTTSIITNSVKEIFIDDNNNLWILTDKGIDQYVISNNKVVHVPIINSLKDLEGNVPVTSITQTKNGDIWVGSETGLFKYDFDDKYFKPVDNKLLKEVSINKLHLGDDNLIYIATPTKLLVYEHKSDDLFPVNYPVGFESTEVSFVDSDPKYVWLGTIHGLIRFEKSTNQFLVYNKYFPANNITSINCGTVGYFDNIYLGLSDKLVFFDTKEFLPAKSDVSVDISNLKINGNIVAVDEKYYGKRILKQSISNTKKIVLPRQARDLSFSIHSKEQYTGDITFKYRLKGLSRDWINYHTASEIRFTNLPFRTYHLQIKVFDEFGYENDELYNLKIKIRRPIWRTWYFLAIVLIGCVYVLMRYMRTNKEQMRGKLKEIEIQLKSKEKQLNTQEQILEAEKRVLDKRALEEKILRYQSNGLAEFSEALSKYHDNVDMLMKNFIVKLVTFLEAHQGAVYRLNNSTSNEYLELCGVFSEDETIKKEFKLGEGYVGTSFKRAEEILVDDIPEDYMKLSSGLGEDKPTNLVIVPIIHNEQTLGVVEIATFDRLEDYKIDFVRKVSENIASSMAIAISNTRMEKMLNQSQEQSERLRSSEEELRQNLEEMQATQEDLKRQMEQNKEMQKDLEKEKALLDAIMNYLPDYLYFKDWNCKFIRISQSMLKLFPVNAVEDMIGKSDFDFQPLDVARKYSDAEKKIMKSGEAVIDDIQHEVMKNGVEQWVATSKLPLYDKNGECIGIFGITKDITKIKKIEVDALEKAAALQENEEELRQNLEEMQSIQDDLKNQMAENAKFREKLAEGDALLSAMMNNLPEYIYFKDRDSKFIRISNSMLKLFPVDTIEEMVGKSDFDFHPHEAAKQYYDDEMKIIETGKGVYNDIQREILQNGVEQWVTTTKLPLYNKEGECIGTFGITKDITDIKTLEIEAQQKAEEVLAQEEELRQNLEEMQTIQDDLQRSRGELVKGNALLSAIMNNLPEYIYFKDMESKFIRISKSMLKLFPVDTLEEMMGKSDFDFQPYESAKKYYDDEMNIIKTGKGVVNDIQHEVMSNGVEQWVTTTKLPLYDENGECIGTFGITKDITDIKELEIEAQQKAEEVLAQEEELRQNLEEMLAIQEDLERSKVQLLKDNALLNALMNNLPEYIYFKDMESKFIRISKSMLKLFPVKNLEEMQGKSDFDFQPFETAKKYFEDEQFIIRTGKGVFDDIQHEVMQNGVEQWVSTTKLPLLNEDGECIGTFGISKDVSNLKQLEIRAKEQAAQLSEHEEELRQQLEEMQAIQEEMDKGIKDSMKREEKL
ncbi:MAG: PAS domain-containing protein, partial [Bacteroidales bacterium]|nr:PAS domain-containing protein [Bacteroidales bacterium]